MIQISCNGMIFGPIAAILFDKDGTLADTQYFLHQLGHHCAAWIDRQIPELYTPLLEKFGQCETAIDPTGLLATGTREENEQAIATLIMHTGRSWADAQSMARSAFLWAEQQLPAKANLTPPFPGVRDWLAICSGVALGILSSDTIGNIQAFTEQYHLSAYFQGIIGAQTGLRKPNPALLYQACEQLGVPPSQTIVIGDTGLDIELAHQAGAMGGIGVTWGGTSAEQLSQADAIAQSINEIQVMAVASLL
jgi:phosphoglycolate phosphatase